MTPPDDSSITELFAEHGLRCTKQRKAVYQALMAAHCHPTADMLYRGVCDRSDNGKRKEEFTGISLATVYNALEALCSAGLARRIAGKDGTARYDPMLHNHLHVVSEATGDVRDVPEHLGQKLLHELCPEALKRIEAELGFQIKQVHIELVGDFHDP